MRLLRVRVDPLESKSFRDDPRGVLRAEALEEKRDRTTGASHFSMPGSSNVAWADLDRTLRKRFRGDPRKTTRASILTCRSEIRVYFEKEGVVLDILIAEIFLHLL